MLKLLKIAFIFLLTCVLTVLVGLLLLIKGSHVDRLKTDYVAYNKKQKAYVLTRMRPKDWTPLKEVSEYAKWAIIVSEDWAFYEHEGVDLRQLKIALRESAKAGEFTRGASTISQQVVKNALLTDERSIWRKLQEAILTLYLEKIVSKDRILELYLNIIELGENVYGIGEASRYYFNTSPKNLNAREGAFLAMLLPSPVRYSVSFDKKELTEFATEQVNSILTKMRQADVFDEEERKRQASKKFYWEKSFFEAPKDIEPETYEDYLESDSFL